MKSIVVSMLVIAIILFGLILTIITMIDRHPHPIPLLAVSATQQFRHYRHYRDSRTHRILMKFIPRQSNHDTIIFWKKPSKNKARENTFYHRPFLPFIMPIISSTRRVALTSRATSLMMAVTPVGPFCPFRSSSSMALDTSMENLTDMGPQFAIEMTKIQLDMSMGNMPDPTLLTDVGTKLEKAVDQWMNLITRLNLSHDFQTKEYGKLTQVHLQSYYTTAQQIASMMKWQARCMVAMADQTPPPLPPPDVDLSQLLQQQKQASSSSIPPSINSMAAAENITATPFTGKESIFDAPVVKQEYEQLCKDHMYLIEYGSKYTSFDPTGKLLYLDMIESIHDRWDIFFQRFQLLNILNKDYVKQCNQFLLSMNLNETQYRTLLKECHEQMRLDAENERKSIYMQ